MDKKDILDSIQKKAVEVQCRDDICSRSTMAGLKSYFEFIPEDMVTASLSLCGGAGISSGSCGAYCSGLLAIGLKFNATMEEESQDRSILGKGLNKSIAFRDAFLKEFGTTQCPQLHKLLFGRSFYFTDSQQNEAFMNIPDHAEKCSIVVGKAARMAAEIILEG
ncbi:MAG: C-GCAxxG-C-C family protein [Eubacteriales bacterium]